MEQINISDKRKKLIILLITLILFIGASFAFVAAQLSVGIIGNANVTADTTDNLQFSVDKDINLNPTQFNVPEGGGGLSDTAIGSASLIANSTNNEASATYNVYFKINTNEYIYTTEDNKPEIVLTIIDPTGTSVTEVSGLTYVTAENADGTTVRGFDITTEMGLFTIASDYGITSASSIDATEQDWIFTVTFINLTTNQTENSGSTLDAEIILGTEKRYTLANYIIENVYVEDGVNGLYYHDGVGAYTNANQEAGDNSYRFSGANPNNYVCFGSGVTPCPDDNLYRIIGVFASEVKLIKADFANSNLLGTDGDYSTDTYLASVYPNYIGNLTTINRYYWNNTGTNTWSESNLNTVNLNKNYLDNIGVEWSSKIAEHTWQVGGVSYANVYSSPVQTAFTYEAGVNNANTTYNAKIGLMYVSDYGYAAIPEDWTINMGISRVTANNWMYLGIYEWTISRHSDYSFFAWYVYEGGRLVNDRVSSLRYGIRPCFHLDSSVAYAGGTGTASDPFLIN